MRMGATVAFFFPMLLLSVSSSGGIFSSDCGTLGLPAGLLVPADRIYGTREVLFDTAELSFRRQGPPFGPQRPQKDAPSTRTRHSEVGRCTKVSFETFSGSHFGAHFGPFMPFSVADAVLKIELPCRRELNLEGPGLPKSTLLPSTARVRNSATLK